MVQLKNIFQISSFTYLLQNHVLYYQLPEASCYWWCNCKTFFRYSVSHIYLSRFVLLLIAWSQLLLMVQLQNIFLISSFIYILQNHVLYYQLHEAVIDGTFANNFSDMGTSHRGGSALLSWRIQSPKRSNRTVCFSRAGDFVTTYIFFLILSSKTLTENILL